jgi:ankyrin repeat protein
MFEFLKKDNLYKVVKEGTVEEVKALFEKRRLKANARAKDENGRKIPLLWLAVDSGNIELAKFLISKGADVNVKNKGEPILYKAVDSGNIEVIKFLVSNGADVNAENDNGESILYKAVERGNIEVIKFLVSKGADINAKGSSKEIPLHCAACHDRNIKIAQYLVTQGAYVNTKDVRKLRKV